MSSSRTCQRCGAETCGQAVSFLLCRSWQFGSPSLGCESPVGDVQSNPRRTQAAVRAGSHSENRRPTACPQVSARQRRHVRLDDILKAYGTFGNAAKHCALKVVLKALRVKLGNNILGVQIQQVRARQAIFADFLMGGALLSLPSYDGASRSDHTWSSDLMRSKPEGVPEHGAQPCGRLADRRENCTATRQEFNDDTNFFQCRSSGGDAAHRRLRNQEVRTEHNRADPSQGGSGRRPN